MKKYLMLAGIFTVLAGNAQSAGWYYEDEGYNQYEARQQYNNQDYYTKQPRYQQLPSSASRKYQERQYTRSQNMNTYQTTETNKIRPYIGLDVMTTTMDFGTGSQDWKMKNGPAEYFEDKNISANFVAGLKFNPNFGLEAFYQQSSEEEQNERWSEPIASEVNMDFDATNYLSFKAYGIDTQWYAPITQEFEILASLGLAQYEFEAKDKLTGKVTSVGFTHTSKNNKDFDSLGVRLGIGGQYNITDHIALRAMARYVHMTDDEYIKSMTELSLGLRYMF